MGSCQTHTTTREREMERKRQRDLCTVTQIITQNMSLQKDELAVSHELSQIISHCIYNAVLLKSHRNVYIFKICVWVTTFFYMGICRVPCILRHSPIKSIKWKRLQETQNRKLELLQKEITGHNRGVRREIFGLFSHALCVPWTLLSAPLCSATSTIGIWRRAGPQKAPSAFAAANRYWVRLALATAAFLFPWPVSQTCSGLPRVQPIEASILTHCALEHRLERVAKTDWQRLRILALPERRRPAPLLQPYTSTYQSNHQPRSTDASTDHLAIPGSVDTWSSERKMKAWSKGRKIKMQVICIFNRVEMYASLPSSRNWHQALFQHFFHSVFEQRNLTCIQILNNNNVSSL